MHKELLRQAEPLWREQPRQMYPGMAVSFRLWVACGAGTLSDDGLPTTRGNGPQARSRCRSPYEGARQQPSRDTYPRGGGEQHWLRPGDSNSQPSDLESDALPLRHTPLTPCASQASLADGPAMASAVAGNRTRVKPVAAMYSATRPRVAAAKRAPSQVPEPGTGGNCQRQAGDRLARQ